MPELRNKSCWLALPTVLPRLGALRIREGGLSNSDRDALAVVRACTGGHAPVKGCTPPGWLSTDMLASALRRATPVRLLGGTLSALDAVKYRLLQNSG